MCGCGDCCSGFKRFLFFLYAYNMVSNFATSISYLITLYKFPQKDQLTDNGKQALLATQILTTIALGVSAATQVWIIALKRNRPYHCKSIVLTPWYAMKCDSEHWKKLAAERSSWEVFKLGVWYFFSHDVLIFASNMAFFKVLKDYASFSQKAAAAFKLAFACIGIAIFLFWDIPKTCFMKKVKDDVGAVGDKMKSIGSKKNGDPENGTTNGAEKDEEKTKEKEKKDKDQRSCCC